MKTLALAAGVLLTTVAATASAQVYYERTYTHDPHYGAREMREARDECWNPGAGHFEGVRPGEVQNDLDFSRCRPIGARYNEPRSSQPRYSQPRYSEPRYNERRVYRDGPDSRQQECWNPRAGHYEGVRPGEVQNDLDFSRCRFYR